MLMTYSRMSNLAHEFFFFFGPHVPPMFRVVAHSCPYHHGLTKMDKLVIKRY